MRMPVTAPPAHPKFWVSWSDPSVPNAVAPPVAAVMYPVLYSTKPVAAVMPTRHLVELVIELLKMLFRITMFVGATVIVITPAVVADIPTLMLFHLTLQVASAATILRQATTAASAGAKTVLPSSSVSPPKTKRSAPVPYSRAMVAT